MIWFGYAIVYRSQSKHCSNGGSRKRRRAPLFLEGKGGEGPSFPSCFGFNHVSDISIIIYQWDILLLTEVLGCLSNLLFYAFAATQVLLFHEVTSTCQREIFYGCGREMKCVQKFRWSTQIYFVGRSTHFEVEIRYPVSFGCPKIIRIVLKLLVCVWKFFQQRQRPTVYIKKKFFFLNFSSTQIFDIYRKYLINILKLVRQIVSGIWSHH